MSARNELRKYVNLLADSWTPRATTDARVERLYGQVRAEVLREAADALALELTAEGPSLPGYPLAVKAAVRSLRQMSDKAAVS